MAATAELHFWNNSDGRPLIRLWRDQKRQEQLARLSSLQLQTCDGAGQQAWAECRAQLEKAGQGTRVDLPSAHIFSRVLGLFRTATTLKKTASMHVLELSAGDLAKLLGYAKSTIEACLRWLDSGDIQYKGVVVAKGLGVITRTRRQGHALVEGAVRRIYRTSKTALSLVGRALLHLPVVGIAAVRQAVNVFEEPKPIAAVDWEACDKARREASAAFWDSVGRS